MKYGIAIRESLHDQRCIGSALDHRQERAEYVALWARGLFVNMAAVDAIEARGKKALIYATTHGFEYPHIIAGRWDDAIRRFACSLPRDAIVRLDPEPNQKMQRAHWQQIEPEVYRAGWDHMYGVIKAERPDVRVAFCFAGPGTRRERFMVLMDYLPSKVDIVGFDIYENDRTDRPMSRRIGNVLSVVREYTDKPAWVFETAIARKLRKTQGGKGKKAWLRDLLTTEGLEGLVYFDMDPPEEIAAGMDSRWEMPPGMRRVWNRSVR